MSHIQRGVASWFCCGNPYGPCGTAGHGKCGTCNSGSIQYAWPLVNPGCDLTGGCRTIQEYPCGRTQSVYSPCTGRTINPALADCGPNIRDNPGFCTQTKNDCVAYVGRIIDLTPAAFTALGLSLSSGLGSVVVTGTCICHPGCPC